MFKVDTVAFDMDGTLTRPRNKAEPDMIEYLKRLRKVSKVGIVSGYI